MAVAALPPLPGTGFLWRDFVTNTYRCNFHQIEIVPVLIGEGALRFPACERCILDTFKDAPWESADISIRTRTWEDVSNWEDVCWIAECFNEANKNFCYACQLPKCDAHMHEKGNFGLCIACWEEGHEAFK